MKRFRLRFAVLLVIVAGTAAAPLARPAPTASPGVHVNALSGTAAGPNAHECPPDCA